MFDTHNNNEKYWEETELSMRWKCNHMIFLNYRALGGTYYFFNVIITAGICQWDENSQHGALWLIAGL